MTTPRSILLTSSLILCSALFALAAARGPARTPAPTSLPAPNITRPATPEKAPDADGFIQRWLVLEPIPISIRNNQQLVDSYVQSTVKNEYFTNQLTIVPRDAEKVMVNGAPFAWHAVDTSTYNLNLYHFAYSLGKPRYNVIFWAVTLVNCPEEIRDVRLAVGSNAASIWWVNGKEVIGLYGDRHMIIDDGVSAKLTLAKGRNVIRCAVLNAPGVSDMCARFLDGEDKPIRKFTVNLAATEK